MQLQQPAREAHSRGVIRVLTLKGYRQARNTPAPTQNMTAVAIHPTDLRYGGITNSPITFRLDAIIIMTAINGAETSPFTTAAQQRAFTGSMCRNFSDSPRMVPAQMTA